MSQWFRGSLQGHYVGVPNGSPGVSQYGSASRYKLRIYRALVREIEVLDGEPEETPEEVPEDCFYQAQIADTRLLGIRPRSCFEGSVYDVSVSDLRITHSTKEGGKTYGRLEGVVYGRFELPPLPEVPVVPEPTEGDGDDEAETAETRDKPARNAEGNSSTGDKESTTAAPEVVKESPLALVSESPLETAAVRDAAPTAPEESDIEPLHPPSTDAVRNEREPSPIPIPLLVVVMAIVLGLVGGAEPALLWLGAFVPVMAVRLILTGLFKVTATQRVFGALLILIQVVCLSFMALDWWQDGCFDINVYAVSGIGITALIASVMPSALPLVCAGGSLGLVLFLWYGDLGVRCDAPKEAPAVEERAPSVLHPGKPRTNPDGSWPRRPSR